MKKIVKLLLKMINLVLILAFLVGFSNGCRYLKSDAIVCGNPYFFKEGQSEAVYEGYFLPLSFREIKQNIVLNIQKIEVFENGELYSLELDQLEPTDDPLDSIRMGARYLGYFYVTEDIIYRVNTGISSIDREGMTKEAVEDMNENIIKLIHEEGEDFLEECLIVCNEEGTENTADENGWHEYVEVDGDRRIFHMYNDYVSGTKEYEQIIWEKGKGITYYQHGAGNMLMHVELGINLYENMEDYNN